MILFANKYANLVKEAVHVDVDSVTVAGVVHDVLGVPVAQADDVTDLKWCEIMCLRMGQTDGALAVFERRLVVNLMIIANIISLKPK